MTFKDYLNLTASDVSSMSEGELRKAIRTLNDVANKRIKRLEAADLDKASPAYQSLKASGSTRFTLNRNEHDPKSLKSQYLKVRNFLSPEEIKTGSVGGARSYAKNVQDHLDKIINKAMEDPNNLDKRYKTPHLKKSVKDRELTKFWEDYAKWREVQQTQNPQKYPGEDSPIIYVDEFYDEYYSQGKTDLKDYEEGAKKDYEEGEAKRISTAEADTGRVDAPKPSKHKGKGIEKGTITERFEKVKIF